MCIKVVDSYEKINKIVNMIFKGVNKNFTQEKNWDWINTQNIYNTLEIKKSVNYSTKNSLNKTLNIEKVSNNIKDLFKSNVIDIKNINNDINKKELNNDKKSIEKILFIFICC